MVQKSLPGLGRMSPQDDKMQQILSLKAENRLAHQHAIAGQLVKRTCREREGRCHKQHIGTQNGFRSQSRVAPPNFWGIMIANVDFYFQLNHQSNISVEDISNMKDLLKKTQQLASLLNSFSKPQWKVHSTKMHACVRQKNAPAFRPWGSTNKGRLMLRGGNWDKTEDWINVKATEN